jgi:hypothetical protein
MPQPRAGVSRRDALRIAGSAAAAAVLAGRGHSEGGATAEPQESVRRASGRTKRVLVAGGGIAGLS